MPNIFRDQRHRPLRIPMGGALEVCSGFWGERLWGPVISALLPPGFHWIYTWRGYFSAGVLRIFQVSFRWIVLSDCFCKIIYLSLLFLFYVLP